jgi:saccharopine dehydrogenase-like NADP-dependent oxidoreductase
MLDLLCEGKIPQSGFIKQEQIALEDFLANRFGCYYQQEAKQHSAVSGSARR